MLKQEGRSFFPVTKVQAQKEEEKFEEEEIIVEEEEEEENENIEEYQQLQKQLGNKASINQLIPSSSQKVTINENK